MSNINYTIGHEAQDSDKEWFSPPQPCLQNTPSPQPHHQHSQLSNPPPCQSTPQTSQPIQEDKSSRAGIISATAGSLTAHLLGGGILSTTGGAMAGAVGAKKISERKREKKQRDGEI
ncbi:hypothetical protein RB213_005619 [Colletotrichum asianum]|uniref:Uncharacterized protein n=1 Tax=Colletotrichum asianum TaxID=702518 RepID=A0A8H3ZQ90_9PEZI|nr:hypothetical protein GQ607_010654 [Colletotrichum asianum]